MAQSAPDGEIQLLGTTWEEKDFSRIQEIYGEDNVFPLEVRLQLSDWIEETFMLNLHLGKVGPLDFDRNQMATNIACELTKQLDAKIQTIPNNADSFLTRMQLKKFSENLKQAYATDPVGLYNNVITKVEKEMKLVVEVPVRPIDAANSEMTAESATGARIRQQLSILKPKVNETAAHLKNYHKEHEQFSVEYCICVDYENNLEALQQQYGENDPTVKTFKAQTEEWKKSKKARYITMQRLQSELINEFVHIYNSVKDLQAQVLDIELFSWKKEQKLGGNGFKTNPAGLDKLQEWCEGLAEVIWPLRQQVRQLAALKAKLISGQQNNEVNLQEMLAEITELLKALVIRTFVVEGQPPQVMKTNTRFSATVRLLAARALSIHMAAPVVSASIVSESQANLLATSSPGILKRKEDYSSGDILNRQGTMEYHADTRKVSVSFTNLQLKNIKRIEKEGTECDMDEKFSIVFWTEFPLNDLKFQLLTFSLPVVVIVHENQESQALATVVWDNGFSDWGPENVFQRIVPDKVTWGRVAETLNMKWTVACGNSLTEDNLYCLACKALRDNNIPNIPKDYNERELTWSLFCKEPLPDRTFTFWEWFYHILLLTSHHMKNLCIEGHILGFVMKQQTEQKLKQQQNGCFLIRFSDSTLGGVIIAYVEKHEHQQPKVKYLNPFTTTHLNQRSMADMVLDINDITVLYPSTPKEVFSKHCGLSMKENTPGNPEYIIHSFVTQLKIAGSGDTPAEIGGPPLVGLEVPDAVIQQSNTPTAGTGVSGESLQDFSFSVSNYLPPLDLDSVYFMDVSDITSSML